MEVSSSSRGLVVIRETPRPGELYKYTAPTGIRKMSGRLGGFGWPFPWGRLCRLNRRRLRCNRHKGRFEILGRFLASAGAVLLKHFASMVVEEVALLRAELADTERQLDAPVLQNYRI